jgi:hypothetical protein
MGLCALAFLTSSAAHAAVVVSAECRTDNTAGVSVNDYPNFVRTTSRSYVDVPYLSVTIQAQGAVADCAFVRWDGSVRAASGTIETVRAVMDGVPCDPLGLIVSHSDQHAAFETSSAQFVCRNLSKGAHVVGIQYRSGSGLPVDMRNRAFTVTYKGQ